MHVFFYCAEFVSDGAVFGGAERTHLVYLFAEKDMHKPESAADNSGIFKDTPYLRRVCGSCNIEILRLLIDQKIPYGSAHNISLITLRIESLYDFYGFGIDFFRFNIMLVFRINQSLFYLLSCSILIISHQHYEAPLCT